MVQQTIEHGGSQRLIVSEGARPLRERQIAGQHDRAALVALGYHVEEQVGLLAPEREVAAEWPALAQQAARTEASFADWTARAAADQAGRVQGLPD